MKAKKERGRYRSSPLVTPSTGLILEKKKGQHLLKSSAVLDRIINAADIKSSDTVLEVGPGTGNLTVRLLPLARKVVALEVDDRMVAEVKKRAASLGYTNLEVIQGDALRTVYPKFDVCVANLPYKISSPFLFRLIAHRPLLRAAVLMFQKEFADRLMADPATKHYSRLGINSRLYCKVTHVCKVGKGCFVPPPMVDSTVVKMVPRKPVPDIDFREWDGLIRVCFRRKNRTIGANFRSKWILNMMENNYKTWCSLNNQAPAAMSMKDLIKEVLEECKISDSRSITIDIERYMELLAAFNRRGIHFVNIAQSPLKGVADNDESLYFDDDTSMDIESDDDGEETMK